MNFYLYSIIAFTVSAMLYYPRARNLGKTYVKNISTPNLTGGDILTLMLKEAKCENVKIRVYKKPGMEKQKNRYYPKNIIIFIRILILSTYHLLLISIILLPEFLL